MNKNKLAIPLVVAALLTGIGTSAITLASAASTDTSTVSTTTTTQPQRTPPAAMGKVTAISGNTITITDQRPGDTTTGTTYTVDASSATVTKDRDTASTVSAIAVGDMIAVDGTVSGDNVTATAIHDGLGGGPGGPGGFGGGRGPGGVMGTVSAINGNTLTVTGKDGGTYTVDASSATIRESGTTSTLSSVKVGDTVMIGGSITTASMTATQIDDGVPTVPSDASASGSTTTSTNKTS